VATRTYIQNPTANDISNVGVIPNGTGTTALFSALNNSDPANAARLELRANAGSMAINSGNAGTGILRPLEFQINGAVAGRMNTDGSWTFLGPVTAPSYNAVTYAANHGPGTWAFLSNEAAGSPSRGGVWADGPNAIRLVTADFGAGVRLNGPVNQMFLDAAGGITADGPVTGDSFAANGVQLNGNTSGLGTSEYMLDFGPNAWFSFNRTLNRFWMGQTAGLRVEGATVINGTTTLNAATVVNAGTTINGLTRINAPGTQLHVWNTTTSDPIAVLRLGQNPTGDPGDTGGFLYAYNGGDLWLGANNELRLRLLSGGGSTFVGAVEAGKLSLGGAPLNTEVLDVGTGAGRIMFRNDGANSTIDAVTNDNSAFATLNLRGSNLLFNGQPFIQGPQVNNASPGNTLSMSWQGAGNIRVTVDASNFTLWSDGNLSPVTTNTAQTITGQKTMSADPIIYRAASPTTGATLYGSGGADFMFMDGSQFVVSRQLLAQGNIGPSSDNTFSAGRASFRYSVVYAGTGAINTSDAREKTPLIALTPGELAAAKELGKAIGTYKWLDMVAKKGKDARIHIGVTAQDVIRIMLNNGLDAMQYGLVCYDIWDASEAVDIKGARKMHLAGDRYGIRYDELMMFIAAGFEARLSALEAAL
jgi:hypothetical protein